MIPSGAELDDLFLLLRIIERGILFLVIVSVTVAFMIVFRRALQNIAVRLKTEELTVSTSLSLSMPIFLLLVLVGFSWVVYSSPISVQRPGGGGTAGAAASPVATSQTVVRDGDIEQIAVILKTLRERRSQVTETNLSTALSRAMLVLDDQLRTLVDTKFGDGSFAFYESTSVQLGPTSASGDLADLGLTTDQADKYYAIEELLSVDALGAQP